MDVDGMLHVDAPNVEPKSEGEDGLGDADALSRLMQIGMMAY